MPRGARRPGAAARGTIEVVLGAPRRVLLAALVLGIVAGVLGSRTPSLLGKGATELAPPGSESARAEAAFERAAGLSGEPQLAVLIRHATPERIATVQDVIRAEPVFQSRTPPVLSRGEAIVSARALAGYPQRAWREAAQRIRRTLRERLPDAAVGGAAIATAEVNAQVERDLRRAEVLAFPVLFVLALFVFRSGVAAILPIVCGAMTIAGTLLLLRGVDRLTPVSNYALNIVTGAGLGLSIDYSLLLVSRYREEMAQLGPGVAAVRSALATAGRTVAFSSLTVGAASATLIVFPLEFLRSMGIAGGLAAPLAGLVSLTVLPAAFVLLGSRVNALSLPRWRRAAERTARGERGRWYRLSHALMRHPVPVAGAAAAGLVALGWPALSMRLTTVDASVLPTNASARTVATAVARDFPPTTTPTAFALLEGTPADAITYAAALRQLPGAALVLPPEPVAQRWWAVLVMSGHPPFGRASRRLVQSMRNLPGKALVGGRTAGFLDELRALESRMPLAVALIAATTLVLVGAATRSLVLPLKSLIMNALTLAAAYGILVLVFQAGRLQGVLDYTPQRALVVTLPVLLFAIVFGLSTDYGVFLLTRIREEAHAGAPNREAVALGLARTGRVVTSAALLFCVAVGAFASSRIILVKEVGIGIAAAVLIDATVVRVLLVPTLMAVLGRWNWWPSIRSRRRVAAAGAA